ncbi:hypothetical protein [Varibaculum cambriense]|uniref:hypothetical protein n=1 Tax=Varibaculum cambriense TaxID=184870 RepID=UPI0003B58664|nr:hypothetical protein [Varibaculum cambriense]
MIFPLTATDSLAWWQDLAGMAALITAIASIPGTIAAWHASKTRAAFRQEMNPDHGSSLIDKVDALTESIASVGHQVGEIRRDMDREHRHINATMERHESDIKETRSALDAIKQRP